MFQPIIFGNIEAALSSWWGWLELAMVGACFLGGWLLDRHVRLHPGSDADLVVVGVGSVNRLLFPLSTLALLTIAFWIYRHWAPPFFIAIALPLAVALAAIRIVIYALHGVFGNPGWLPASERAIAFAIWGLALLYFLGVLPEIAAALDALTIPMGSKQVSVLQILHGTFAVLLTATLALWISGMIERRVLQTTRLDPNVRAVLSKFIRAILLTVSVLFALDASGVDLTLLTVFGGALGVGIGLGLQKLASNYIAGFAILLDRSIRVGDMITVDGRFGSVSKVTSRYVVLTSLDGVDAIVPNETVATTTVLNHTYASKSTKVTIPVRVGYDSDLDLALSLLTEAAAAEPRVRPQPGPPLALVVRFADSGIDLEVGFWIDDPEKGQGELKSAINRRIWKSFQANGIRIPYPQREYRLLAGDIPPGSAPPFAPPSSPSSG